MILLILNLITFSKEKRLFAIDDSIGAFHLSRENVGDVLDDFTFTLGVFCL